jgi:hypothetical protein
MGEGEQTKVCPLCAETIKAAARVCPHCQSKLGRFARWRYEVGIPFVVLVLLGEWIALVAWIAPDDKMKGRCFAGHQADLRVDHVSLGEVGNKVTFQITGVVTNMGNYPWRVREIEVRVLGYDGELIEALHPRIDNPFVVQSAQQAAFCLPLSRLHPDAVAAELQARVQDASDGNLARHPD